MSAAFKDNEQIRRDDAGFRDAVRRARKELGGIKGVVGVGYGLKEKKGEFTQDISILVYVSSKEPAETLAPEDRVPATFDGYRTDVRVVLPTRKLGFGCDDDTAHDPITGGIQIEAGGKLTSLTVASRGTLGCIVRKRGDQGDDNVYLLTCAHVLINEELPNRPGDGVYHPYFPRPGSTRGTQLGKIDRALLREGHVDHSGKPVADEPNDNLPEFEELIPADFDGTFVDCAAVRIDLGSFCCGSACTRNDVDYAPTIPHLNPLPPPSGLAPGDIDRIVDVRDLRAEPVADVIGMRVIKNGVKSGRTVGNIAAVGPDHSIVHYEGHGHPTALRYNVVQIVLDGPPSATNPCSSENTFGLSGDSGSLIVDEHNHAVALLYAGSMVGNDAGIFITDACLIVPVLDTLGMCIPTTTGTSHGSSRATDGSGLATYAGELELPQDDDKLLFSSYGIAAAAEKARSPLAQPATREERARMQPLLDTLLETELGRELHDAFSQMSREIAHLVRRNRRVQVTWHRSRGPAFLASVLSHVKGETEVIPREIGGITRETMLDRMGRVLHEHGSNPLREAIERHRERLMLLAGADSAAQCIELLRRTDEESPA